MKTLFIGLVGLAMAACGSAGAELDSVGASQDLGYGKGGGGCKRNCEPPPEPDVYCLCGGAQTAETSYFPFARSGSWFASDSSIHDLASCQSFCDNEANNACLGGDVSISVTYVASVGAESGPQQTVSYSCQ